MFSAIGTVAVTATGSSSVAASTVVAITAAAPLMSDVMWSMFAAGLIEMPPVSNVMPLPTSATCARGDGATRPAQPHQPRLARRALPHPEHAAEPGLGERGVVEHLDLEPRGLGQLAGARGERLGVEVVGRGVDEVTGGAHRLADRGGRAEHLVRVGGVGDQREPGERGLAVAVGAVGRERVRAEQAALRGGREAARSARPSVLTAWSVPASARAAAPDARRTCSGRSAPSPSALPRPTATSSGAATAPRVGSLTTSSALPVAPATASSSASCPSKAASSSSAPGARRGGASDSPLTRPITTASASTAAGDPSTGKSWVDTWAPSCSGE